MPPKRGVKTPEGLGRSASKPSAVDTSFTLDDVLSVQPRVRTGPNREDAQYLAQLELCRRSLAAFPDQSSVCPEVPYEHDGPPRGSRFYTFYHDPNWAPGNPAVLNTAAAAVETDDSSAEAQQQRADQRVAFMQTLDGQTIRLLQAACIPASIVDLAPPAVSAPTPIPLYADDNSAREPPTAAAMAPPAAPDAAGGEGNGRRRHANGRARIVYALRPGRSDERAGGSGARSRLTAKRRLSDGTGGPGGKRGSSSMPRLEGSRAHDHLVRLNRKVIASQQGHKIGLSSNLFSSSALAAAACGIGSGAGAGAVGSGGAGGTGGPGGGGGAGAPAPPPIPFPAGAKNGLGDRPIWSAKQISRWEGKWPVLPGRRLLGSDLTGEGGRLGAGGLDGFGEKAGASTSAALVATVRELTKDCGAHCPNAAHPSTHPMHAASHANPANAANPSGHHYNGSGAQGANGGSGNALGRPCAMLAPQPGCARGGVIGAAADNSSGGSSQQPQGGGGARASSHQGPVSGMPPPWAASARYPPYTFPAGPFGSAGAANNGGGHKPGSGMAGTSAMHGCCAYGNAGGAGARWWPVQQQAGGQQQQQQLVSTWPTGGRPPIAMQPAHAGAAGCFAASSQPQCNGSVGFRSHTIGTTCQALPASAARAAHAAHKNAPHTEFAGTRPVPSQDAGASSGGSAGCGSGGSPAPSQRPPLQPQQPPLRVVAQPQAGAGVGAPACGQPLPQGAAETPCACAAATSSQPGSGMVPEVRGLKRNLSLVSGESCQPPGPGAGEGGDCSLECADEEPVL